jgi:hypothetical protein
MNCWKLNCLINIWEIDIKQAQKSTWLQVWVYALVQIWMELLKEKDWCSWYLWKALKTRRGAWAWFHRVWTCIGKGLEYWMISSLKLKLNCSWKFRRNWSVPVVLLERSRWAGFNGIYLIRFGFKMWEILIF